MGAIKTPDQLKHLIKLYQSGLTYEAVGKAIGVSPKTVHRHITRAGLERGRRVPHLRLRRVCVDETTLLGAYDAGGSVKAIAEQYGIAWSTVARILNEHGRATRNPSEAERLKWSKMTKSQRCTRLRLARDRRREGKRTD